MLRIICRGCGKEILVFENEAPRMNMKDWLIHHNITRCIYCKRQLDLDNPEITITIKNNKS